MRLLFAGTPEVALPSLERLLVSSHEVVGVLTRPDAPSGRGRRLEPSPVAHRALERGLPVLRPDVLDAEAAAEIAALSPDCCPVVAYGGLVPRPLLGVPRHGWVNLHFSLLPAWRGAAPVQHALLHGDEVTGASTFLLEEGLDTGPVYGTVTETVRPADTAGDLLARLASSGAELLAQTMDGVASGELRPVPQSTEDVSHAPKLTTEDARVRWTDPALAVDRRIRACTPAPGAWSEVAGVRLGLLPLAVPDASVEVEGAGFDRLAPGQVAVTKGAVYVGTGSVPVGLGQVRPAGRRPMSAADWARGARLVGGERFL
jgi:methionyl-tRNA formyltransferase